MLRTTFFTILLILLSSLYAFSEDTFYDLKAKLHNGQEIDFYTFKNKVLLITNFSLKCGTTYQLSDLEEIYQKYNEKDFLVLGFPSESFAKMDQKNSKEIHHTCTNNYGVTFPIFETIHVNGKEIHEVFKFLTASGHDCHVGEVQFNAEKFLIGKDGKLIERYGPFTGVNSRRVTRDIEEALK